MGCNRLWKDMLYAIRVVIQRLRVISAGIELATDIRKTTIC
jgi:hypothetical protein